MGADAVVGGEDVGALPGAHEVAGQNQLTPSLAVLAGRAFRFEGAGSASDLGDTEPGELGAVGLALDAFRDVPY